MHFDRERGEFPRCSRSALAHDARIAGTELTYDYQFVAFAEERWECMCGETTCR